MNSKLKCITQDISNQQKLISNVFHLLVNILSKPEAINISLANTKPTSSLQSLSNVSPRSFKLQPRSKFQSNSTKICSAQTILHPLVINLIHSPILGKYLPQPATYTLLLSLSSALDWKILFSKFNQHFARSVFFFDCLFLLPPPPVLVPCIFLQVVGKITFLDFWCEF